MSVTQSEGLRGVKLAWDTDYYGLSMEPHLRSATPLAMPGYCLHLAISRNTDRASSVGNDPAGALVRKFNELEASGRRLQTVIVPPGGGSYFGSNIARDLEVQWSIPRDRIDRASDQPSILFTVRLELHTEYCGLTICIPWKGKVKEDKNDVFWDEVREASDPFAAAYRAGLLRCYFLLRYAFKLNVDFLATSIGDEATIFEAAHHRPAKDEEPLIKAEVFGAFEGLIVPESLLPGWAETAFESSIGDIEGGRFNLNGAAAERLMARLVDFDRRGPREGAETGRELEAKRGNGQIFRKGWRNLVACGMLGGQVLYASTLGHQTPAKPGQSSIDPSDLRPLRYLLLYSRDLAPWETSQSRDGFYNHVANYNWPLSRLIGRLHEIASRRLAALRDIRRIWMVERSLREIEDEADRIDLRKRGPDVDIDKQLKAVLEKLTSLPETFAGSSDDQRRSLHYRIARTRHHSAAVEELVRGLGVTSLGTFQDYQQFVNRRLYRRFKFVDGVGQRLEQLNLRIQSLIEYRTNVRSIEMSERGIELQLIAHVVGSLLFAAQISEFAWYVLRAGMFWILSGYDPEVVEGLGRLSFGIVGGLIYYSIWREFGRRRRKAAHPSDQTKVHRAPSSELSEDGWSI